MSLELIVTPNCNSKCSYCYFIKHGDKTYPKEIRNPETILSNLNQVCDHLIENEIVLPSISLFSGELFTQEIGFNVLEILAEKLKEFKFTDIIRIPTNGSFIGTKFERRVEVILYKLRKIDVRVGLSLSIDGLYLDKDNRPLYFDHRTEKYYDKVFKFAKKNNCGFHPMISAYNIEKWKDNYDWWLEKLRENEIYLRDTKIIGIPMTLEVRDDNWTEDKINIYVDLLDHMFKKDLEFIHHGNIEEFALRLFGINCDENKCRRISKSIIDFPRLTRKLACSIQNHINVRLGDLAIVPCHRTMYPEMIYGYVDKDNKIISNNNELALKIYAMNPNVSHIKCTKCPIRYICIKGCLGSQLETNLELFYPCETVCNMLMAKYIKLYSLYKEYNLFEVVYNLPYVPEHEKERIRYMEEILCNIVVK